MRNRVLGAAAIFALVLSSFMGFAGVASADSPPGCAPDFVEVPKQAADNVPILKDCPELPIIKK